MLAQEYWMVYGMQLMGYELCTDGRDRNKAESH